MRESTIKRSHYVGGGLESREPTKEAAYIIMPKTA